MEAVAELRGLRPPLLLNSPTDLSSLWTVNRNLNTGREKDFLIKWLLCVFLISKKLLFVERAVLSD